MESCFGEILCFQDRRRHQEPGRSKFLEDHAKEFGLLDFPFCASSSLYCFHYKEKHLQNQRSFILYCPCCYGAGCPFQIRYKLTPSEIGIWEKGEHYHSRDHSKTIPVAAAKQIQGTIKLAPVGQCTSKLHQELYQSPLTRLSPTKSKVRAIQHMVLVTNMDKIIEMHCVELDNKYNSVHQVHLACIFLFNFQFSGLSCNRCLMAHRFSERLLLHNENLRTNHLPPHDALSLGMHISEE